MTHHHESILNDPRLWVAVSFTIFFVIFGRKFWGLATGMLDKRAAAIKSELEEAARLRIEAEALLREANLQKQVALREAKVLLENASMEAKRLGEAAQSDAEAAASRRERMAVDRITSAEQAALTEVRLAAVDLAILAVKKVLAKDFSAVSDGPIIDQSIRGLPSALLGRRAA